MTHKEKTWMIANSLCAHALSGGTVRWDTMTAILSEALQAAETEAEQRGVEQEREACAKMAEGLAFFEEGDGGEIESAWAYRNLAAKIRDRGTP